MKYSKEWLSYNDQLQQLIGRGLSVTDENKALEYLERIGYYRLSGYWYAFRELTGPCCPLPPAKKYPRDRGTKLALESFKEGVTFDQAVRLYVFDKKLRLLAMDALERIEIAFRVDIAHLLGERDQFAYLNPDLFYSGFSKEINQKSGITNHQFWLNKQAGLINRSKEEFTLHNKKKYGLPLPIWIACEVWDFGALSNLFAGMKEKDQDVIAKKYGLSNGRTLATWLRSLNFLRNVCAHHARLWNKNITDQPSLPSEAEAPWILPFKHDNHALARPFLLFCIAKHLINYINPSSTWWTRFYCLLDDDFPHDLQSLGLTLRGMGIVDDWQKLFD